MSVIGSMFTLERSLPTDVLTRVLTGQYSVHGGVVRSASGQIVRHLVPTATRALDPFGVLAAAPSIYNTYQLNQLTQMTQQLMAMSTATMAMSGLTLAVSAIGFKVLRDSLKRVEDHLARLDQKIEWIKTFLDTGRRASLLSAVEELACLTSDEKHRDHILYSTRSTLSEVAMHYLQHWDEASDVKEAMAYQHYYCMAFLAKSRCSAELGMFDSAVQELETGYVNWQVRARHIARDKVLAKERARFLDRKFAEEAPIAKVAAWMDFAYDEKRGYDWIDVLREEFVPTEGSVFDRFKKKEKKVDYRDTDVLFLDNIVSRNEVLQGYDAQLRFLAKSEIRPSLYQSEIESLISKSSPDAREEFVILAPR